MSLCAVNFPSETNTFATDYISTSNIDQFLQGRVVEEGSPQELLAVGGRYAKMWARQASVDDIAGPEAPTGDQAADGEDTEQACST